MAPSHSCPEWRNTLVGLQMSVPQHWWLGMSGNNLHQGSIDSFLEDQNLWLLKMDDINEQELYHIRWDAVLKYVDVEAGTFAAYRLPAVPVPLPADEAEIARKKYVRTTAEEWTKIDGNNGRPVAPIPYTNGDEAFSLNMTPKEIEGMKDASGNIRFHKVMQHLLP